MKKTFNRQLLHDLQSLSSEDFEDRILKANEPELFGALACIKEKNFEKMLDLEPKIRIALEMKLREK